MKITAIQMVLFNKVALVVWVLLTIPTFLWWLDSVPWVVGMSLYAIQVTHLSALLASRVEAKQDDAA